jgi:hypothetical protein
MNEPSDKELKKAKSVKPTAVINRVTETKRAVKFKTENQPIKINRVSSLNSSLPKSPQTPSLITDEDILDFVDS